jgi:hypothetical protein
MEAGDPKGPDYEKDSPEDEATEAPSGKDATTEADEGLAEDQLTTQTDNS